MNVAPRAKKIPKQIIEHGISRTDDYYWLRERGNPEVRSYLEAENSYVEDILSDTKELQQKLFEEMKGRMNEDDVSAPFRHGLYFYYSRTEKGKQYAIFCRKYESLDAPEEIILDENELAQGHEFLSLAFAELSPDHSMLAYAVDYTGNERYQLRIKNLSDGSHRTENIDDVQSLEWANDNETLFYTVTDSSRRPYRVMKHVLGAPTEEDTLVFEDVDERYFVDISKSRSDQYIFIESGSKLTSEVQYIDADKPRSAPLLIHAREQGHEYSLTHQDGHFLIMSNKDAKNFKVLRAPVATPGIEHWEEFIPAREEVMIEGISAFKDFIVVYELENALTRLRIISNQEDFFIPMPDAIYSAGGGANAEYMTETFRYGYSTPAQPSTIYDFNVRTKERELVKKHEVRGGFDETLYATERIFAAASDGAQIPISIAYKIGSKTGMNPCWLYGYGSYGHSIEAGFSESRISLLDRGFVFAIAHIRGGGEKGRNWYDEGKFLAKKNTFTDFIACAEHLIAHGYSADDKLVISGRSAGGLLMGAVTNMRPDLFHTVVTAVPFVDVINTMMDPTIPLTVTEYEEWGNPNEQEFYDYMRSYSPYDNVEAKEYPHILITAGLNDTRVQYWEPAKWVAKLRDLKTDENMLLLKTDMGSGHGGASGRYDAIKEIALEFAFTLTSLGIKE